MMSVPSSEAGVGAGRGTGICVAGTWDGEACTISSIVGVAEASWESHPAVSGPTRRSSKGKLPTEDSGEEVEPQT